MREEMWSLHLLSCFRVNDICKEVCGIVSSFLPNSSTQCECKIPSRGVPGPFRAAHVLPWTMICTDLKTAFSPNNAPAEVGTTVFKFCLECRSQNSWWKYFLPLPFWKYWTFTTGVFFQLWHFSWMGSPTFTTHLVAWSNSQSAKHKRTQAQEASASSTKLFSEEDAQHPGPEGQWNSRLGAILI